ncbi:DUF4355 domain-containing protein [Robertmurraya kyonggiensis]|uniref:DUF4355 domain-containing protein n=1 Tax=Robertmurraya kyonggiensis TaxID=1037680 RepID=A0A4U1D061_9BACI|nr:DUF4355 domain-containing protein [Robertmurraya kyonggiensis]TKC15685.1 DUF4355 domain-containing protein [Robertmurraya kyonggiensis]
MTLNVFDQANRLKNLEAVKKLPRFDLQFFADPDPDPNPDPNPNPDPPKKVELTEEELQKKIEAEADRKLASALAKKEKEWEAKVEAEKKEAERLAKLSEKERKDAELKKREDDLAKRIAELDRKELKADAITVLGKESLPVEFADFLLAENAEKTLENINSFKKTFDEAVAAKVKEALAGKPPKVNTNPGGTLTKDEIMKEKDPLKRQKLISENMHLFEKK